MSIYIEEYTHYKTAKDFGMEIWLDKSHTWNFLGKDPVRCKIMVDNKRLQQVNNFLRVWVVKFPKQIKKIFNKK
jgi:hypothetical protein